MLKAVLAFFCLINFPLLAREQSFTDRDGLTSWIYTPDRIQRNKTYWVVVGVHGYRGHGKGAAGLASWVKGYQPDCIVVGPSFNDGYQAAPKKDCDKLLSIVERLGKKYKLHPRIFVYGHSGGAQFAHRFLFKYPNKIAGCSAHSAGTWELNIPNTLTNIPCAFSCGERDTGKAFPQAPYSRIEFFKHFEQNIKKLPLKSLEITTLPNAGHAPDPETLAMTKRCYTRAKRTFSSPSP
ncbi:hypothetical protein [Rubritalea tangerina]|uniref:Alpha/beta hydrolase n=1 Tax=Rubritalea tangerina TaxID=430798 RepID=A0ABW4ZF11_9BACT